MTRLTQKQLQDATDAFDRLPEDSTLLELVKQYDLTKQTTLITLSDAWKEYRLLNIRTDENRDGSWVSKSTIIEQDFVFKTIIASLGSKIIKDICTEDLPNFWQSKKSDQTRLNHFKKIKSFFSWCLLKDYHFKDILALEKTPKVKRHALPQVLTLDQAKRLLEVSSRPKYQTLKPFVALCLFAGLRAGEIHAGWNKEDALKWEDFTLVPDGKEKPFLSLPFVGKMKSSRNVDLPPILVEILLKAKEDNLDVVPSKNGVNLWLRN